MSHIRLPMHLHKSKKLNVCPFIMWQLHGLFEGFCTVQERTKPRQKSLQRHSRKVTNIEVQRLSHHTAAPPSGKFVQTPNWKNDAESLWVAVRGKTTGWVAVGFDPDKHMKGANFLLAYVQDDSTTFRDDYGSGRFKHQSDTELGGKDHILECRGKEEKAVTTVEFKIPLNSGDQYDKLLKPKKEYTILLGLGKKDDFRKRHFLKAKAKITLD